MDPSLDWQLFQAFLAVVREGSLSGAARALGVTQPTVGRQVAALEQALRVTLFTRSHDGLAPTEAAARLVDSAQTMAAAVEAARRTATGAATEERGTVRVTASEVVGAEVLPPMLARFQALHPRITLELALTNQNEDLLRRDADIAVRMIRPSQGALIAKRVGTIDIGLYAHRRYLKSHPLPRRLEDLGRHALIGYDRDRRYDAVLEKRTGLKFPRDAFALRTDNDLAQIAALRAGVGVGMCQLGIARRDRNLVPVLHAKLAFSMETWLAMHEDLRGSRRIRLVFDHLAAELSTYADGSRVSA